MSGYFFLLPIGLFQPLSSPEKLSSPFFGRTDLGLLLNELWDKTAAVNCRLSVPYDLWLAHMIPISWKHSSLASC